MRTLVLFICILLVAPFIRAANPAFTDFNTNQFRTSGNKVTVKDGANLTNTVLRTAILYDPVLTNALLINPSISTTLSNVTIVGVLTVPELDASLIITTNGIAFTDTLVANFGTPDAGTYPVKYSSDVITSKGTGGYVRWDGSAWFTWEDVAVTADVTQYILNAVAARLNRATPKSTILCSPAITTYYQTGVPRTILATLNGSMGVSFARSWGVIEGITTGTLTNGYCIAHGPPEVWSSFDFFGCGGSYSVDTASDTTETYNLVVGIGHFLASGYPSDGAFFLYDVQGTRGHGIAATNNWICVTAGASSYTYADSGLPVTIGSTAKDDLGVILTGGSAKFYTNGVLCANIATTLPVSSTVLELNQVQMMKRNAVTGTTSRTAYESRPWTHIRFNTPRVFR